MKKFFIKFSILLVITFLILCILTPLFIKKGNGYGTDVKDFYKQKDLDIIYFGSSHTYTAFNPKIIKDITNLKGYDFATQQQPIEITYYYLKEALKTQKIKYAVLDVLMLTVDDEATDGVIRDAIDKMKLSKNKIDVVNDMVSKKDRKYYYINFFKYHSRWNELNKTDLAYLTGYTIDNQGHKSLEHNKCSIDNPKNKTDEITKIDNSKFKYLVDFIDYANENDVKVILVKTPISYNKEIQKKLNYIWKYADKNNIDYIDFNNLYAQLNIDVNKDFYDSGHLAESGSKKLSTYFGNYLNK